MTIEDIHERYKTIEGFDEYIITESGKVYCQRTRRVRGCNSFHEIKPKTSPTQKKYFNVILCNGVEQRTVQIHRLVAKYFVDGYFDGAVVNHIDGNIYNNHYTNLEWVTQQENIIKSYESSGIDQVRNFFFYELTSPDGKCVAVLKGLGRELKQIISDLHLPISYSGMKKYHQSSGYSVQVVKSESEAVTTT